MLDRYGHISDKLLAAFLDSNTTKAETEQVLGMIEANDDTGTNPNSLR